MSQTDRTNGLIGDTGMKAPVRLATTAAITLTGEQTIDGVAAVTGDSVLVKNQADTTTNGIYLVDTAAWSRRADCDGPYDLRQGSLVLAVAGTTNAGKTYECTSADPIVAGSSALTFTQYVVGAAPATPISLGNGGFGQANTTLIGALSLLGLIQCTAEGGTANVQTATIDAGVTALRADQLFIFNPTIANTNAATLTLTPSGGASLGSPAIKLNGAALTGGELQIGVPALLQYDGTALNILGNVSATAVGTYAILKTFVAAKGDLIGASANDTPLILSVGADGTVLQPDSTQAGGLVYRSKIVSLGLTAATSGASIDFTGIPTWAKRIKILFLGVSTSGTSNMRIQLGDAGGVESSGYASASSAVIAASASCINSTAGFDINDGFSAAVVRHGHVTLELVDAATFTWALSGALGHSDSTRVTTIAGTKATSQALDRVRITTAGGSDTFDAGSINVTYE